MRNRSVAELDKLFEEVGTYRKSEQFRELLEFVKRFPDIAPYRASPWVRASDVYKGLCRLQIVQGVSLYP